MWQKLSLRSRINLLVALVLALGLAINIARLVLEAAPRVQAEDQSVIRLAREFVETIVSQPVASRQHHAAGGWRRSTRGYRPL